MRKAAVRGLLLALCVSTAFSEISKADSISISGGALSGNTVLFINALGYPQVYLASIWEIDSTLGGSWTNQTSSVLAPVFEDFGTYMSLAFTSGVLDSQGTGTQNQAVFALSGTVSQFAAQLSGLAIGQTIQLPLLTTGSGCEKIPGTCTGETISHVLFNDLVGQTIDPMIGAGFLTITNDPGLYEVTLTSVPLQNSAPEPTSLYLTGTGIAGLLISRRKKYVVRG